MATLEDTILGDVEGDQNEVTKASVGGAAKPHKAMSHQTGPKGVLDDFSKASDLGELTLEVGGDAFLELWRQKELKEMKHHKEFDELSPTGELMELTQDTYSSSIDNNKPNTVMIIHVYGDNPRCKEVTTHLSSLSFFYPQVRFCQVNAINAGMSESFQDQGLPAILVYRGTEVIGNYPNVSVDIAGEGNEVTYDELESFLFDHSILFPSVTRHNTMEAQLK